MKLHDLDVSDALIAAFCQRHRVKEMLLFGSIVTEDEFGPDSDVDVIVEFESKEAIPHLFDFAGMQLELTELFGRQAHLNTPDMVSPSVLKARRKYTRVAYAA